MKFKKKTKLKQPEHFKKVIKKSEKGNHQANSK